MSGVTSRCSASRSRFFNAYANVLIILIKEATLAHVVCAAQRVAGLFFVLGMLTSAAASGEQLVGAAQGAAADQVSTQTAPFSDLPSDSWVYPAVTQLEADGIIKGYPDGTFKGNRPITRYEAALLAYRAVTEIEARITSDRDVEKNDIALANKLSDEFSAEMQAVERHLAALQKQEDAETKNLGRHERRR